MINYFLFFAEMQVKQEPNFLYSYPIDLKPKIEANTGAAINNDPVTHKGQYIVKEGEHTSPKHIDKSSQLSVPSTESNSNFHVTNHEGNVVFSSRIMTKESVPNGVSTHLYVNDFPQNKQLKPPNCITTNEADDYGVSHNLPKRIAQTQQYWTYQPRKERLAQPKQKQRSKQSVIHHYANPQLYKYCEAQKNIQCDYNCFNKVRDVRNINREHQLEKNTMSERCDSDSDCMEGLFGWTKIDNVHVPYIFRSDNEKYVCVRLLEQKILKKYPNIFPEELAAKEPLTSSFITSNECQILNQLVKLQNKGQGTSLTFVQEDVLVGLSDFMEFYNAVKRVFQDWPGETINSPKPKTTIVQSGWMQINNTIVPYIRRLDVKLLPLDVLKHAASIDIRSEGLVPFHEECEELNRRCSGDGLKFVFKSSSKLVPLYEIECIPNVQTFELPEKDPFTFAKYLQSDDNPTHGGLKLNLNQEQLKQQSSQCAHPISSVYSKMNPVKGTQLQFKCDRFPSIVQRGPPNVSIAHHAFSSHPSFPQREQFSIPANQGNLCPRMGELSCEYPNEKPSCGRQAFLNTILPGQSINVNYGINIQNISSPAAHWNQSRVDCTEGSIVNIDNDISTYQSQTSPDKSLSRKPSHNNDNKNNKQSFEAAEKSEVTTVCTNKIQNQTALEKGIGCTTTVSVQPVVPRRSPSETNVESISNSNHNQTTYQMKQQQAINELLACIKGVWLCGKNISCMHLLKQGRSGKFCLVEAVCKLYYGNTTVSHFLFTIESVLSTYTCTEQEEQAFIQYYQLPVSVLKCNKMIELSAFEKLYPQLAEVLNGVSFSGANPHGKRCQLPMPDINTIPLTRKRPRQQNFHKDKVVAEQSKTGKV